MLPSPATLRLTCRTPLRKKPRAPLGATFADDATDIALVFEGAPGSANDACAEVPDGATLAEGALLVVFGQAAGASFLTRIFASNARAIPRDIRATALLARGYVDIGAGVCTKTGADLVWGYAPVSRPC
jgi:hypothetical protein